MTSKKGVTDLLVIRVYPFVHPFDIDRFSSHVVHRTTRLFAEHNTIGERCFIAITALDPETRALTPTLSIVAPKWGVAPSRDAVYADVREFLASSQAVAVSSASETEHDVTVSVEWNGKRSAFAATKIRDATGLRCVLAQWERVGAGVAMPLLPTTPCNLH